jgi:hypothetical protein
VQNTRQWTGLQGKFLFGLINRENFPSNLAADQLEALEGQEANLFHNSETDEEEISEEDAEYGGEDLGKDDYIYKQRKFNYLSELAIFAEYETLRKVLFFIRGEDILWNHKDLNESIFSFVRRIVNDLNADWLFFQMDYLSLFNTILQNAQISNNKDFKEYTSLLTKIVQSFFKKLEGNSFLLVESLFR